MTDVARLCWEITPANAAEVAFGPAVVAAASLAVLLYIPTGPPGADTGPFEALLRDSTFRFIYAVLLAALVGMALAFLVAGLRHQPALALDGDGVTTWTELRLRRIPWQEVRSIGPIGTYGLSSVLYIELIGGRSIRVHQQLLGERLVTVVGAIDDWMGRHGPPGVATYLAS